MTQKLTGAALLAEVDSNPRVSANELAMRTGYTKQSRSRSGESRVKPDREAYYEAVLLARGDYFGLVMPETQKTTTRGDIDSFKIQKNGAGIVPRRFMEMLDCQPSDYFTVKEGEGGTLSIIKDVERSEAARLEAAANPTIAADDSEDDEEEEDEDPDADDDEDEEEVAVQQPAIPGVDSTTIRIPQAAATVS